MAQQIRQNYHEECEALVNKQINLELHASYVYIAMASYFNRDDQALTGFTQVCRKCSDIEHCHGVALMDYQTKRGGKVVLQDITKPSRMEWGTPLEAVTAVLEMEKTVCCTLQDLQAKAIEKKDFHLVDFIQKVFLRKKVNFIKEIGDLLTKIKRVGNGVGLHIVDCEIQQMVKRRELELVRMIQREVVGKGVECVEGKAVGEIVREVTDCLTAVKMF